jgi:ABC-type antimicrobial peptide transport system permease subunit
MGIRVALGARASDVRRLVLRRALTPVAAGVFVGGTAALLASRLVSSLTFEVRNTDPVSFAAAIGLLLAVALVGAWLPARRATRVSPLEALRSE